MGFQGKVDIPFVLRIIPVAALDISHPLLDIHDAGRIRQRVAELDEPVVVVVDHGGELPLNKGRFFGCGVPVADIAGKGLVVERVAHADAGHFVIAQLHHIGVAVRHMAEVPLAVAAANVVQQAQHERLVRV